MRLENKVALVTGSSRGVGKAIALALAREGADVVVTYRRRAQAAAETGREIEALGRRALVLQADVVCREDVKRMMAAAMDALGRLDILINNAGSFPMKPFTALSEEDWDQVMALDLKGVFLCCKEVLPVMRQQRKGHIVNVASVAGLVGGIGLVAYSAAKAGVIGLTKALAREVASLGITVNAIAPGIIETETALKTFPASALEFYTRYQVPLARLGQPADVTGLVVFLASDEADYITGQVYAVDGGFTMH